MPSFQMGKYQVVAPSGREIVGTSVYVSYIHFWDTADVYKGRANFYPDGITLPDASYDGAADRYYLHYNLCQFHALMEMLREESPIRVGYSSPTWAYICTGAEPVGEDEGP